jgi:hypothetical protein
VFCTYVQRGSYFCFVVVLLLLSESLVRILNYCPISPCFQHIAPFHAALPGSLARQPCPAALPGSLARQPCPAALPGSLDLRKLITGRAQFQAFFTARRPAVQFKLSLILTRHCDFEPCVQIDKLIRERG